MSSIASSTTRRGGRTAALAGAGVAVLAVAAAIPGAGASLGVAAAASVATVIVATILTVVGFPRRGLLLAAAASALALGTLGDATTAAQVARGVAIASQPVAFALASLSLAGPSTVGRIVAILGAIIAGPTRALFDDPFTDATCSGCGRSAFAVLRDPDLTRVVAAAGWIILGIGAALLVRRASAPPVMIVLSLAAIIGVAAPRTGPELAASLACLGASVAAAFTVSVGLNVRRRLSRLASIPAGEQVSTALREIVGDGQFHVDYPVEGSPGAYVDAAGRVSKAPAAQLQVVRLQWEGCEIARLHLDDKSRRSAGLVMAFTPELLAGIDGQRLSANLAARVAELRLSRTRVVRRADEERRRLERDLHDGAQQHLLALGMELRTALLTGDLDEDDRGEVEKCVVETGEALDRLREIAHGAYPSLLASSGLEPALRSLARRRGAHLRMTQEPPRLPHSVEGLAYTVVADLLENGHGSDVGEVSLRVESGLLIVDIDGPETEPASLLRERVGALDGTLERRTDTNRWRLIVPCE